VFVQRVKGSRKWNTGPQTLYSDGKPFSVVGIDIVKGMGQQVILTCTDLYSRYIFTWAIPNETAGAVIGVLRPLVLMEAVPKVIICDNGPCFIAKEFKKFAERHGIAMKYVPRYSGFYAGFYEKHHHTLVQTLITTMEELGSGWKKALPVATSYLNMKPYEFQSDGMSLTSFEVFKGRSPQSMAIPAPMVDPRPTDEQMKENVVKIAEEHFENSPSIHSINVKKRFMREYGD
jgi:hypothetical protein